MAEVVEQFTTEIPRWSPHVRPIVQAEATPLQQKSLEVTPTARVNDYVDYFGSHVHYFNLLEPHDFVEIRASSVVETTDAICCGPKQEKDPRPWIEKLAEYVDWSPAVPMPW